MSGEAALVSSKRWPVSVFCVILARWSAPASKLCPPTEQAGGLLTRESRERGTVGTARFRRAKTTEGRPVAWRAKQRKRRAESPSHRYRLGVGEGCRAGRHWPGAGDTARFLWAKITKAEADGVGGETTTHPQESPRVYVTTRGEVRRGEGCRAPNKKAKQAGSQTHPVLLRGACEGPAAMQVEVGPRHAAPDSHVYSCGAHTRAELQRLSG